MTIKGERELGYWFKVEGKETPEFGCKTYDSLETEVADGLAKINITDTGGKLSRGSAIVGGLVRIESDSNDVRIEVMGDRAGTKTWAKEEGNAITEELITGGFLRVSIKQEGEMPSVYKFKHSPE